MTAINITSAGPRIKSGSSRQRDPLLAVQELAESINQADIGLVIIFASSRFDLEALGTALNERFGPATVIGCTTAGEIGPDGYHEGSLSGVSIHRDDMIFEVGLMASISQSELAAGQRFAHQLKEKLCQRLPTLVPEHAFAFMLVDGLCVREELISRAFYDGLSGIPLIGGSAGDDLAFKKTQVLCNGRFVSDAALLLVATTPFLFDIFKTQHFVSGNERMVVTAAIPEKRIVTEINGCPAAEEYARAVGLDIDKLDSMVFAAYPVLVRIGNADFVRSIQKINPDGSLTFFCAIDNGIVFKISRGVDMIENLATELQAINQRIGPPSLILGCDCILRHLEAKQRGIQAQIGTLMAGSNVVGFSTYGEQFGGMHINQTFTGIAIGKGRRS